MPFGDDTGGPPIPGGGGQQQGGGGGAGGAQPLYGSASPSSGPMPLSDLLALRRRGQMAFPTGGGASDSDTGWMEGLLQHIASHPAVQGMVRAYRYGGTIREPVAGIGLSSGSPYSFGEAGPEQVTPMSSSNNWSSTSYDPLNPGAQGAYSSQPTVPGGPRSGLIGGLVDRALSAGPRFQQAGSDYIREQVRRKAEADALARQGSASKMAAYYAGSDPAAAGYAQLESGLHGQSDVANALSEADLRLLLGDQGYEREKLLMQLQASLQPQQNDTGSILSGIGSLVGAFRK